MLGSAGREALAQSAEVKLWKSDTVPEIPINLLSLHLNSQMVKHVRELKYYEVILRLRPARDICCLFRGL